MGLIVQVNTEKTTDGSEQKGPFKGHRKRLEMGLP